MKERPILFSGAMARALLTGEKTQTRRALKAQPPVRTRKIGTYHHPDPRPHFWAMDNDALLDWSVPCPYGQPGDRLWVRETWQHANHPFDPYQDHVPVFYRADYLDDPHGPDGELSPEGRYREWRPSIHMPRAASRITLEITGVRVERLHNIKERDVHAEGCVIEDRHMHGYCAGEYLPPCLRAWRDLWASINGADSWNANPWVWVLDFRRIR